MNREVEYEKKMRTKVVHQCPWAQRLAPTFHISSIFQPWIQGGQRWDFFFFKNSPSVHWRRELARTFHNQVFFNHGIRMLAWEELCWADFHMRRMKRSERENVLNFVGHTVESRRGDHSRSVLIETNFLLNLHLYCLNSKCALSSST